MVRNGICGVSVDALKDCCSHFNLSYVVTGSLLALISNFICWKGREDKALSNNEKNAPIRIIFEQNDTNA